MEALFEQIEDLETDDFNELTKKYFNLIKTKQRQKFNNKFPNLELEEYSKISHIRGETIFYYHFRSQVHKYEFEIHQTKHNKYGFNFYVDDQLFQHTNKITKKKNICK